MSDLSVVAVGGGHGQSTSLRAIRRYAATVTAVVSVADDGGSSGRLRAAMPDLPAPGDVRKCLCALAADGSALGPILEHRFDDGTTFAGHALGNLMLVALADQLGSFAAAVEALGEQVGAVGRVLPATVGPVGLEGMRLEPGTSSRGVDRIHGQVAVQNATGVFQVTLTPEHPTSDPEVGAVIRSADQVVLGPGSLFTSVLAAAVVPAVHDALHATRAQRVYVANLGPQVPETQGFTVADELDALARHGVPVDVVVADLDRPLGPVPDHIPIQAFPVRDARHAVHDPVRLAEALVAVADLR